MLVALSIRDIVLIDRLSIDFAEGMTVLTGETGAGKSILLDSLGFVLGWKVRPSLVRAGAERGEVIADDCRYGVVALGDGGLAYAADDEVVLLEGAGIVDDD